MTIKSPSNSQFLIYQNDSGQTKIEVRVEEETVWLSQSLLAELFQVTIPTINEHLKNIFEEGECDQVATIRKFRIVRQEGSRSVSREIEHYNLDIILSVGYRVKSKIATRFRQWATERLKEYIIKGFTMDDERLKNPNQPFGKDYFDEQLARIRDIRSSERRFYQKITDIYAKCSSDYDPTHEITHQFFATIQNKLHFAITGQTAAELIHNRIDAKKENLGLTHWKNAPKGMIRKTDITIAQAEKEYNHFHKKQLQNEVSDFDQMVNKRSKNE